MLVRVGPADRQLATEYRRTDAALKISLMENTVRAAMHPADETPGRRIPNVPPSLLFCRVLNRRAQNLFYLWFNFTDHQLH